MQRPNQFTPVEWSYLSAIEGSSVWMWVNLLDGSEYTTMMRQNPPKAIELRNTTDNRLIFAATHGFFPGCCGVLTLSRILSSLSAEHLSLVIKALMARYNNRMHFYLEAPRQASSTHIQEAISMCGQKSLVFGNEYHGGNEVQLWTLTNKDSTLNSYTPPVGDA